MQILLNSNKEIIAYAEVGGFESGIEVNVPKSVLNDVPLSYSYIGGKFIKITNYGFTGAITEKLAEISAICQITIVAGCDVETAEGTEHFSLTANDQINLSASYEMIRTGATHALYHADGKLCRMFTAEEIIKVMTTATKFKTYHTTYCNHLNTWLNRCKTVEEIQTIVYGTTLPTDLLEHMNTILGVVTGETTT